LSSADADCAQGHTENREAAVHEALHRDVEVLLAAREHLLHRAPRGLVFHPSDVTEGALCDHPFFRHRRLLPFQRQGLAGVGPLPELGELFRRLHRRQCAHCVRVRRRHFVHPEDDGVFGLLTEIRALFGTWEIAGMRQATTRSVLLRFTIIS
jgi:hypothetical protein